MNQPGLGLATSRLTRAPVLWFFLPADDVDPGAALDVFSWREAWPGLFFRQT